MKTLPYTESNVLLVQDFLDETKQRILDGVTITFTSKAQNELATLSLTYNLDTDDIERAILNLTPEDYYRGIDPSGKADFDVCAFYTHIGDDRVGIYLKYGLVVHQVKIVGCFWRFLHQYFVANTHHSFWLCLRFATRLCTKLTQNQSDILTLKNY